MKNLLIVSAMLFTHAVMAQQSAGSTTPSAVQKAFGKLYPNTKVSWEKEGGNYEAGFKQQGHAMSVLYTADGALLEIEKEISRAELPSAVQAELDKRYKGKTVREYAMITKTDGEINYEAEISGKDVLFASDGKFLKEIKD